MDTITLKTPIKRGNTKISEVSLIDIKAGGLRGLSLGELSQLSVDAVITVIPRITRPSITEQEAEDLPLEDLMALAGKIYDVMQGKVGNGTTPQT